MKKVQHREFSLHGFTVKIDGDTVDLISSTGKRYEGVIAKELVLMTEALKSVDKHLNFFCIKHGHYGATKGQIQKTSCDRCGDSNEVYESGNEDNEG